MGSRYREKDQNTGQLVPVTKFVTYTTDQMPDPFSGDDQVLKARKLENGQYQTVAAVPGTDFYKPGDPLPLYDSPFEIYVDSSFTGTSNGEVHSPFKTIQAAIEWIILAPSQNILNPWFVNIAPGTYDEDVTISHPQISSIVLKGRGWRLGNWTSVLPNPPAVVTSRTITVELGNPNSHFSIVGGDPNTCDMVYVNVIDAYGSTLNATIKVSGVYVEELSAPPGDGYLLADNSFIKTAVTLPYHANFKDCTLALPGIVIPGGHAQHSEVLTLINCQFQFPTQITSPGPDTQVCIMDHATAGWLKLAGGGVFNQIDLTVLEQDLVAYYQAALSADSITKVDPDGKLVPALSGIDYAAPAAPGKGFAFFLEPGTPNALQKTNGVGDLIGAVPGTDYAAPAAPGESFAFFLDPVTNNALQKTDGAGKLVAAVPGVDFVTPSSYISPNVKVIGVNRVVHDGRGGVTFIDGASPAGGFNGGGTGSKCFVGFVGYGAPSGTLPPFSSTSFSDLTSLQWVLKVNNDSQSALSRGHIYWNINVHTGYITNTVGVERDTLSLVFDGLEEDSLQDIAAPTGKLPYQNENLHYMYPMNGDVGLTLYNGWTSRYLNLISNSAQSISPYGGGNVKCVGGTGLFIAAGVNCATNLDNFFTCASAADAQRFIPGNWIRAFGSTLVNATPAASPFALPATVVSVSGTQVTFSGTLSLTGVFNIGTWGASPINVDISPAILLPGETEIGGMANTKYAIQIGMIVESPTIGAIAPNTYVTAVDIGLNTVTISSAAVLPTNQLRFLPAGKHGMPANSAKVGSTLAEVRAANPGMKLVDRNWAAITNGGDVQVADGGAPARGVLPSICLVSGDSGTNPARRFTMKEVIIGTMSGNTFYTFNP